MHELVDKPWGNYKVIHADHNCQIKLLKIEPRKKINDHSHAKRDEQWTVVVGEGEAIIDGKIHPLKDGDRIFVPRGSRHIVENKSVYLSLKIVEIQTGVSFSDDDIFRF